MIEQTDVRSKYSINWLTGALLVNTCSINRMNTGMSYLVPIWPNLDQILTSLDQIYSGARWPKLGHSGTKLENLIDSDLSHLGSYDPFLAQIWTPCNVELLVIYPFIGRRQATKTRFACRIWGQYCQNPTSNYFLLELFEIPPELTRKHTSFLENKYPNIVLAYWTDCKSLRFMIESQNTIITQ